MISTLLYKINRSKSTAAVTSLTLMFPFVEIMHSGRKPLILTEVRTLAVRLANICVSSDHFTSTIVLKQKERSGKAGNVYMKQLGILNLSNRPETVSPVHRNKTEVQNPGHNAPSRA